MGIWVLLLLLGYTVECSAGRAVLGGVSGELSVLTIYILQVDGVIMTKLSFL